MQGANIAKLFAKLIKMYRAAYVTAAQASTGGMNISDIIMKAILGGKSLPAKTPFELGKLAKGKDIMSILSKIKMQ